MNLGGQPIIFKILFLFIVYIFHGRPFVGLADYAFALLVAYLLLFGKVRDRFKPTWIIAGIAFMTLTHFVPQLSIPEHQRLLIDRKAHITQPEHFLENLKDYPFSLTADGYIQGNHDKRFVNSIDIDQGVLSLRTGWINRPEFNFHKVGDNTRADMPFVVCYTIIPSMIGMKLTLEGRVFFEQEGNFIPLDSSQTTLKILPNHIGQKLCGFGGRWDGIKEHALRVALEKTPKYKFYDTLRILSTLMGLVLLFWGFFVIAPTYELFVQSGLLGLSALSFWFYFPKVSRWGILAKGGTDGIIHDGFPYWMLEKWVSGDWQAALTSPERIFYFMPGMRYIRFIEMLLFGDAYILQVCLVIFIPLIFYRFFCVFLIRKVSIVIVSVMFFYLLNGIGLSYKFYLKSLLELYGEGFAYALLFISLTLLSKSIKQVGRGIFAFFLFSICLSIRPNMGIFVGILCIIHLFTTTFSSLSWKYRFVMLFGLVPSVLIPIHNFVGGEFVLITKAAQISENLSLTPIHYFQGICHMFGLIDGCEYTGRLLKHFEKIYPQYVLAWLGCIWLIVKTQVAIVRSLALACFGGLSVHFFFVPDLRYLLPYLTTVIILALSQYPRFRALSSNTSLS